MAPSPLLVYVVVYAPVEFAEKEKNALEKQAEFCHVISSDNYSTMITKLQAKWLMLTGKVIGKAL